MPAEITLEDHFAELAKQFRAAASVQTGPHKTELERLAECYMQLAVGGVQAGMTKQTSCPE